MELFVGFLISAALVLLTMLLAIVCSDVKKLLEMQRSQQVEQLLSQSPHQPQSPEDAGHP